MSLCITSLFVIYRFGMHIYGNFRLSGGVTTYPMTFSKGFKFVKPFNSLLSAWTGND